MADRVKGIVVEIGGDTTGLDKALSGTNKKINSTQKQLRDVERLLKLDPTNTNLLEQRQRLLATAVSETREKLDALNDANVQVAKGVENYDDWKAAYDPIQQEIADTQKALADLKARQQELADCGEADTEAYAQIQADVQDAAKKLRELKEQAKAVSEEFGNPISMEQYDSLQREIAETEIKLRTLETKSAEADAALEDVDAGNLKAVAAAAEDASEEMDELATAAKKVKDTANTISDAMRPATAAVVGLAGAAAATVPATEELRVDLSRLDANAKENAVSADAARKAWREFALQSGETDSAVEATSNLLQAGFTESNLQKAVEGLAGAAQRFPDTLKVESLADSLQETLASGAATGQFLELLERMSVDTELFATQLSECQTEADKQNLILETLAKNGLMDSYNAWKQNNEGMLANQDANLKLQESMAQMAEVVLPAMTMITENVASLVSWFANLPPSAQYTIAAILAVVAAISPMASAVSGASSLFSSFSTVVLPAISNGFGTLTGTVLPAVQNAFSTVFGFIAANPVVLLIGAIVGLVALIAAKGDEIQAILEKFDNWLQGVFATDWTQVFGPVLGGALNDFFAIVKEIWDGIKQVFDGVVDFVRGVFTGDWERAWSGVVSIFKGIFSGLSAVAKAPINAIISLVNGAIGGINSVITKINKIPGISIGTIGKIPMLAKGGTLYSGDAIVGEAGPELLTVSGGKAIVRPLTNSSTTNNTANLGSVVVNVYAQPGQDEDAIAMKVVDIIGNDVARKAAIFGG